MTDQEAELYFTALDWDRKAACALLMADSCTDDERTRQYLDERAECLHKADQCRMEAARMQVERMTRT